MAEQEDVLTLEKLDKAINVVRANKGEDIPLEIRIHPWGLKDPLEPLIGG